jgi:hypothetical protein
MGDGHEMATTEVVAFYRGHKLLSAYLVKLMEQDPAWIVRRQGHGVVVYCPFGHRDHHKSVPHTPPSDGSAVRKLRGFVGRCSPED